MQKQLGVSYDAQLLTLTDGVMQSRRAEHSRRDGVIAVCIPVRTYSCSDGFVHGCSAPSLKHSTPYHAALRMLSPSASLDGRKGWSIPCCPEMGSALLFSTRARARLDDRIYRVESSRSNTHSSPPWSIHASIRGSWQVINAFQEWTDCCMDGLHAFFSTRTLTPSLHHTISAPHLSRGSW